LRYGAPSHRLQDHLAAAAEAVGADVDVVVRCGVVYYSFDSHSDFQSAVQIISHVQCLNFARLAATFHIHKEVIRKHLTAQEATQRLRYIHHQQSDVYPVWARIIVHGLACTTVGPLAFDSGPFDLIPQFVLGCVYGMIQLLALRKCAQIGPIADIIMCFVAALVGWLLGTVKEGLYFCSPAITQSSIAMLLPGPLVLTSALELLSNQIWTGIPRLGHAIFYLLCLNFGLTLGVTLGVAVHPDSNYTLLTCSVTKAPPWWYEDLATSDGLWYIRFLWAPAFAACIAVICQASIRQLPVMVAIATLGFQVSFWAESMWINNAMVTQLFGALAVGMAANIYSRGHYGLMAAAMSPAIFLMVPGALAAYGTLWGAFLDAATPESDLAATRFLGDTVIGMVELAIAIGLGLYTSTFIVDTLGRVTGQRFSF
jgi:uncharacterized membrane protein YjjP (DUF1212 family)